jgi:hypothetical protein
MTTKMAIMTAWNLSVAKEDRQLENGMKEYM